MISYFVEFFIEFKKGYFMNKFVIIAFSAWFLLALVITLGLLGILFIKNIVFKPCLLRQK